MRSVVATLGLLFSAACPASNEPTIDEPCLPGDPACPRTCDQFRPVGDFELCTATTDTGYSVVARYTGAGTIDVDQTELRIAGDDVPASQGFDAAAATWTLTAHDLAPGKYSVLLRARTTTGERPRALFAPLWIGQGGYADFGWKDAILYQILTDRFLDGDSRNNLDNGVGDLARVDDPRSRWQGGDFAGITAKLREGYFDALGVNTLWISSPIINSHNSQPSVGLSDPRRFASYHSYHPIATGYTDRDDLCYATPIEPAFGTAAELHERVREAHLRGMRVIPDFVVNHVHKEARLYADHPGWFFGYNACDNRWDVARIGCWFTTDMPDFDYGGHPDAVRAVQMGAFQFLEKPLAPESLLVAVRRAIRMRTGRLAPLSPAGLPVTRRFSRCGSFAALAKLKPAKPTWPASISPPKFRPPASTRVPGSSSSNSMPKAPGVSPAPGPSLTEAMKNPAGQLALAGFGAGSV